MGLFKCCCKTCEGCGRQMLDQWNVGTGAAPKTRWRFAQHYGLWSLYDNVVESTPARCPGCERRFTVYDELETGPFFGGVTDWKFAADWTCQSDIDGDLYCIRLTAFASIQMVSDPAASLPDGNLSLRMISGKAYKNCDPEQPEECTHLVVAKMSGDFIIRFALYSSTPFVPCGSLPGMPGVEDIPTTFPSSIDATQTWRLLYRRVSGSVFNVGQPILTTPYNIIRARTFVDITESNGDIDGATGNGGFILIPSKHNPDCCSVWDCPASIDCSGSPSMNVTVSTSPAEFNGCIGNFPGITGITTATPSWNIDGGNWELFDVA